MAPVPRPSRKRAESESREPSASTSVSRSNVLWILAPRLVVPSPRGQSRRANAVKAPSHHRNVKTAAVTAARAELSRATFAVPSNPTDISAKAQALAAAELAVAVARAEAFLKFQETPEKLNAQQVTTLAGGGSATGGGGLTAPGGTMAYNDYYGFTKIFDGETLKGWDGETDIWTVDNGAIHSDNSPGRPSAGQQHHIVYVGAGSLVKDFHLKVEFKLTSATNPNAHPDTTPVALPAADAVAGGRGGRGGNTVANGGIQYRSRLLTGHGPNRSISDPATIANPLGTPLPAGITTQAAANAAGIAGQPWQVSGYQFDLDSANQYTGQLYEGQGRSIVSNPGKIVQLFPGGLAITVGSVSDDVKPFIKEHKGLDGEWNQAEVICIGNTMIHMLNGHVITVTVDNDPVRRASQGIISVQLEGTGQVWYRNIYLKAL